MFSVAAVLQHRIIQFCYYVLYIHKNATSQEEEEHGL